MSASTGNIAPRGSLNGSGYSSVIRLRLRVNGHDYFPAQVGAGRLYFNEPLALSAQTAELTTEVDGHPRSKTVRLLGSDSPTIIHDYAEA